MAGKAICLGFFESYFGYFYAPYLGLGLLDASASCLDTRVPEGLEGNREEVDGY